MIDRLLFTLSLISIKGCSETFQSFFFFSTGMRRSSDKECMRPVERFHPGTSEWKRNGERERGEKPSRMRRYLLLYIKRGPDACRPARFQTPWHSTIVSVTRDQNVKRDFFWFSYFTVIAFSSPEGSASKLSAFHCYWRPWERWV